MKDYKKNENEYMVLDDSVDIGKEPLPIENEEAQKIHDKLIEKYKKK